MIAIALIFGGLLGIGESFGYLGDTENSVDNSFSAATLDFSASADDWNSADTAISIKPGDSVERNITVSNNGSVGFQYKIGVIQTGGDDEFCNSLQVSAKLNGVEKYIGLLFELSVASVYESPVVWNFTLNFPDGSKNYYDQSCDFEFVYTGWQEDLNWGEGYNDIEEITNNIVAATAENEHYSSIADSYVNQYALWSNYGNDQYLNVKSEQSRHCIFEWHGSCWWWQTDSKNQRSFVKFDFHLPRGTTILSSALNLYMNSAPSVSRNYETQRVSENWTETGIRWEHKPDVAGPISVVSTGVLSDAWLAWDVAQDVQNFVDGTNNNGWQIKDSAENSSSPIQAQFRSREYDEINYRPYLDISFRYPDITTDHLVINEVYYDIGSGKGSDPENEWLEIYNPTNSAVNISNWKICDNNNCDIIPITDPIPAKGFAIASGTLSTFDHWTIPSGVIKIDLPGSKIGGNGLQNWGDKVILKDAANREIDSMSYGLGSTTTTSGNGKSLVRILKGYDTDLADDWIINASPNPGTNPSIDGVEYMRFTDEGIIMSGTEAGLDVSPVVSEEENDNGNEEISDDNIEPDPEEIIIVEDAPVLSIGGDNQDENLITEDTTVVPNDTDMGDTDNAETTDSIDADNGEANDVISDSEETVLIEEITEAVLEVPPATNEVETMTENTNIEKETVPPDTSTDSTITDESSGDGEAAPAENTEVVPPTSE